jgi:hypothetical protein
VVEGGRTIAGCVAGIIKSFQGSEKLINLDDRAAVELTQSWRIRNCSGVGNPGGQNSPLFGRGEVSCVQQVVGMREDRRGSWCNKPGPAVI